MIYLFNRDETNFNHNETILPDVISATVTEEANGMFELELEYPRNEFAKTLSEGKILKVPTARGNQLFRIYKPIKNLKSYKVYARHIFYDLSNNFLEDVRPTSINGAGAMSAILSGTQFIHSFTGSSNISNIGTAYYVRLNPVQALLGADNAFIKTWGGDLVRNNYSVAINASGGSDRGYEIRLGKNLIGIDVTIDESSVYTRIYPTVVIVNNVVTTLPEKYINSPLINNYECPRIIEQRIELTDDQKALPIADIYTLMRGYCSSLFTKGIDKPTVNYKVDFVELSKTEQFKDMQILEQLDLYDTVSTIIEELDVNVKAKVIKTVYDSLKGRYSSIELGSFKESMASQTKNNINITNSKIAETSSKLEDAFELAQQKITGNLGGYVIQRVNASGKPYEILIMDTEDINTATNVIRMNKEGIAFSKTGYNGPFTVAATIDGHIVANFIDTGTLNADLITTGTINADLITTGTLNANLIKTGFNNIGNNVKITGSSLDIYDSSAKLLVSSDSSGQRFYNNDVSVGYIGTSSWSGQPTKKGLAFNLRDGVFMSWGKYNSSDGIYYTKLSYHSDSSLAPVGLHLGATLYADYNPIYLGLTTGACLQGWNTGDAGFANVGSTTNRFSVTGNDTYTILYAGTSSIRFFKHLYMNNYIIYDSSIQSSSDIRLKKDISDTKVNGLDTINALECKEFVWKDDDKFEELGFIAQQVGQVNKKFIGEKEEDEETFYTIDQMAMIPYLVKSIQELSEKVNELELKLDPKSKKRVAGKRSFTYSEDDKFDLKDVRKSPITRKSDVVDPKRTGFRQNSNGEMEFIRE